jgi:hypothetical protein
VRFLLDIFRERESHFVRRRIEIAIVLSLLIHGVALWKWFPHEPLLKPGDVMTQEQQPLTLRVVPSPRATPEPPQSIAREAPPQPPPTPVKPRPPRRTPPPTPPVLATPTPAPIPAPLVLPPTPPAPPPVVAQPMPPPPTTAGDLASYIAERRRARGEAGESTATVDSESARRDRAIASNLASMQTSTFGNTPQNGGGTFQIRNMDFDDAKFSFFGWNRDINRRSFQVIEVRRGSNPTINLAIVRKIIEIIRDHETGDFHWDSKRLGRDLMLSARKADTAELEAFMMKEFFNDSGQPR